MNLGTTKAPFTDTKKDNAKKDNASSYGQWETRTHIQKLQKKTLLYAKDWPKKDACTTVQVSIFGLYGHLRPSQKQLH